MGKSVEGGGKQLGSTHTGKFLIVGGCAFIDGSSVSACKESGPSACA